MIESRRLVVRPCTPPTNPSSATKLRGNVPRPLAGILDADTGLLVGHVYQRQPEARWRRWLAPGLLAVHEAEDEPLVFTVQRPWIFTRTWEVYDADGHVLGAYRPARHRSALWVAAGSF